MAFFNIQIIKCMYGIHNVRFYLLPISTYLFTFIIVTHKAALTLSHPTPYVVSIDFWQYKVEKEQKIQLN